VKCLVEALDVQLQEMQKRDAVILKLVDEVGDHNKRVELMSTKNEEIGVPTCKICCRASNVVTKCDNHTEDDGIVGCSFCALNKCPLCRSENIYHEIIGGSNNDTAATSSTDDDDEDVVTAAPKVKIIKKVRRPNNQRAAASKTKKAIKKQQFQQDREKWLAEEKQSSSNNNN